MRTVQISKKYILREDGKLFNIKTGEEYIPSINHGYYKIKYKGKCMLLHRLIAELFIPNPENKPCIDHINHNTLDNRVENLRWVTVKENNDNKTKQLPKGIRRQDIEDKHEYNRLRLNDYRARNREKVNEYSRNYKRKLAHKV